MTTPARPSVVGPRPSAAQPAAEANQAAGLFDNAGNATEGPKDPHSGAPVDPETGEVAQPQRSAPATPQATRPAAPAQAAADPTAAAQARPAAAAQAGPAPAAPSRATTEESKLVQKQNNSLQLVSKTGSALNAFLTQYSDQIKGALPKHMTAERLIRITSTAVSRNPKLLECDMGTMVAAVIQCGQLGLEPDTLGQAYLVPFFNNKTGRQEVQFIPGYKGLRTLAYRSGAVKSMHADIVYEKDHFDYSFGAKHFLDHKPYTGNEDAGAKIGWYAYAHMANGGFVFVVLRQKDIDKAKAASKAQAFLWKTDPDAMEKKTAVRRLCDELPMSVDNVLTQATMIDLAAGRQGAAGGYQGNGFRINSAEEMLADTEQFENAETVE